SSNTVLEPATSAMLAELPEVTAHFGRFRVTEISLGAPALGQFDAGPIEAAKLLADARCDVIAWNGTSGGWLGFAEDRRLCQRITEATSIPAVTSVLALSEVFRRTGVTRFGLVTPYLDEVQERIKTVFATEGFACIAERHLGRQVNFSFSEVDEATIERMVREVAAANPEAITIFCTNLRGAGLVDRLERELGIPIYDTVALAVWAALREARIDPARITGWGRLFALA